MKHDRPYDGDICVPDWTYQRPTTEEMALEARIERAVNKALSKRCNAEDTEKIKNAPDEMPGPFFLLSWLEPLDYGILTVHRGHGFCDLKLTKGQYDVLATLGIEEKT